MSSRKKHTDTHMHAPTTQTSCHLLAFVAKRTVHNSSAATTLRVSAQVETPDSQTNSNWKILETVFGITETAVEAIGFRTENSVGACIFAKGNAGALGF